MKDDWKFNNHRPESRTQQLHEDHVHSYPGARLLAYSEIVSSSV